MEKYFITLQAFTLEEYEVWKQLNKYCNFETGISGYTVNQLVVGSDKRLELTTQKVRTILKKFEKEGYIQFLTSGSKGKESTLKIVLKNKLFNQQQCNNYSTNKTEQLQGFEGNEQQQSNNNVTTLQKKKEKNNILIDSYTQNDDLKTTINDFISMRNKIKKPVTQRALKGILNKLDSFTNNDFEKILILENSIENCWLSVYELKNKKASTKVDTGKKNNNSVNPNICNSRRKYTQSCDIG
jgi:DNA primase